MLQGMQTVFHQLLKGKDDLKLPKAFITHSFWETLYVKDYNGLS
jgi:hypothetical protein